MNSLRGSTKLVLDNKQDLELYINDLHPYDRSELEAIETDSETEHSSDSENHNEDAFLVRAFCLTEKGESVSLDITDFEPYFYIKVPEQWRQHHLEMLMEAVKQRVYYKNRNGLTGFNIVKAKPFSHFTGKQWFQFAKLSFSTYSCFRSYSYIFKKKVKKIPGLIPKGHEFKLYESNINPLLRLIHACDIKPSGWIKLKAKKFMIIDKIVGRSHCQAHLSISYKDLESIPDKIEIPNLIYAAYDIEADSSHGDFPLAEKSYQKLARELMTEYFRLPTDKRSGLIIRKLILRWLEIAFDPYLRKNSFRLIRLVDESTRPNLAYLKDLVKTYVLDCCQKYVQSKIAKDLKTQENLAEQLHFYLEHNLPLIILDGQGSDYQELAQQILDEYYNHRQRKTRILVQAPVECVARWLDLAFDPLADNLEISHVYTVKSKTPNSQTLNSIVPNIVNICQEAERKIKLKTVDSDGQKITRETFINQIDEHLSKYLPSLEGDPIIQIGTTFKKYGQTDCFLKHIIVLDSCAPINNQELIADEHKSVKLPKKILLQELQDWVKQGLSGYFKDRSLIDKIVKYVTLSNTNEPERNEEWLNEQILHRRYMKQLTTDQSEVIVESYQTEKEVLLAWTRLIQKSDPDIIIGYNTFGFDFKYMYHRAQVLGCVEEFSQLGRFRDFSQQLKEQKLSSSGLGDNLLYYIEMYGRNLIDLYKTIQASYKLSSYKLDSVCKEFLFMSKNDLPPKELFILQKGTAQDRAVIARYCLIDCILCNRLIDRLKIITNNIGMSNVCSVPLSYLFLRGQGIKIFSLVSKECAKEGFLIPVLKKVEAEDDGPGFEGAIVLKAHSSIYFDPVMVVDYSSLYPSNIIAENLSHDSYVLPGSEWDNLPDYEYNEIEYDLYEELPIPGRKTKKKVVVGKKKCRFVQLPNGEKSLIPRVLKHLLKARKDTRKEQKRYSKDSFQWGILEGLQLAYKVTCNSTYGQMGARTSPIYLQDIAACTTAAGRKLIHFTRDFYEANYPQAKAVYGDTDSVFIRFKCQDLYGQALRGLDAIYRSMQLGIEGAQKITSLIKPPNDLEFEKVMTPFILLSKKRYTAEYYTEIFNSNHFIKSMGSCLSRRDFCPIVKIVYRTIVQVIMEEQDLHKAMMVGRDLITSVLNGEYSMDKFIISKTLRSYYKNPEGIAHAVLARRIGQRQPGSKPQSNDRVPYCFIKVAEKKGEKILQGNRIETPEFIVENNLQIDYRYYVEHQLMKPIVQIFDLTDLDAQKIIFDQPLREYDYKNRGIRKITDFWGKPAKPRLDGYAKVGHLGNTKSNKPVYASDEENDQDDHEHDDEASVEIDFDENE